MIGLRSKHEAGQGRGAIVELPSAQCRTPWQRARYIIGGYPVLSLSFLLVISFSALAGPLVAPYDPVIGELDARHLGPLSHSDATGFHLLGTDHSGRDLLSRILFGARNSVWVMIVALTSGMAIGIPIALAAGWYRGVLDEVVTRIVDIWMALPFIMVALLVITIFGSGTFLVLLIVLALTTWSNYVRIVRAEVFVLRELDYISAARVCGASSFRIMRKHLLPGVMGSMLVLATMTASGLILAEATLSFLGIGIAPPKPSWGVMIEQARGYMAVAPHELIVPATVLLLMTASLNFLGDWVRDRTYRKDFVV